MDGARTGLAGMPEQVSGLLHDAAYLSRWVSTWGPSANLLLWSHAMYLVLRDGVLAETRYGPLLAGPDGLDITNTHLDAGQWRDVRFAGPCRFTPAGEPGAVWTLGKLGCGYRVLHLINLTGVEAPLWNSPQPEPPPVGGISVRLEVLRPPRAVWCASPDAGGGRPVHLPHTVAYEAGIGLVCSVALPELQTWTMLVVEDDPGR